MRRIVLAVMTTISSLALLFSYHTSRNEPSAVAAGQPSLGSAGSSTPRPAVRRPPVRRPRSRPWPVETVQTRWGPVQVEIVVGKGQIVSSNVLQVPSENAHDQQINSYAVPILNAAAVSAQSANIDGVSGATITSEGYKPRCSPRSTRRTSERHGRDRDDPATEAGLGRADHGHADQHPPARALGWTTRAPQVPSPGRSTAFAGRTTSSPPGNPTARSAGCSAAISPSPRRTPRSATSSGSARRRGSTPTAGSTRT